MLDCVIVPFLLSQAKSFSRNGYTSFMKVKADCEKEENEMKWLGLYLANDKLELAPAKDIKPIRMKVRMTLQESSHLLSTQAWLSRVMSF